MQAMHWIEGAKLWLSFGLMQLSFGLWQLMVHAVAGRTGRNSAGSKKTAPLSDRQFLGTQLIEGGCVNIRQRRSSTLRWTAVILCSLTAGHMGVCLMGSMLRSPQGSTHEGPLLLGKHAVAGLLTALSQGEQSAHFATRAARVRITLHEMPRISCEESFCNHLADSPSVMFGSVQFGTCCMHTSTQFVVAFVC
jgi:hypothetical protein